MASVNRCENCGNWYPKNGFHVCASLKKEVEKQMTKSSTPLVDSLGVFVEHAGMPGAYVSASDLEAALERLPKLQTDTQEAKASWFTDEQWEKFSSENRGLQPKYEARIIGVQEIKREPVKVELETKVGLTIYAGEIKHEKLKQLAGKKVRVTVEEVEE